MLVSSLRMLCFSRLAGLHAQVGAGLCAAEICCPPASEMEPAPHAQNLAVVAPVPPTLPATHPEHKKPPERPKWSQPPVK